MKEEEFKHYLKKKGKKPNVIERNVNALKNFEEYLKKEFKTTIDKVNEESITNKVRQIEVDKQSAKGFLYIMMNYFKFINNRELLIFTSKLREERSKKSRKIFSIKDFQDINKNSAAKLGEIGIKNVEEMLARGATPEQRKQLSINTEISEDEILEFVKLSDIARTGYVKSKLARLYYNAGIDSPLVLAKYTPEKLREHFEKYIEETGWKGQIPFLKDLKHNIANAKKLKKVVVE